MQDFTKLRAWQEAEELAVVVVEAFRSRGNRSIPGLRSQAIRAATSVPANIAEGCGKVSPAELARYAEIACGSIAELRSHVELAHRTRTLSNEQYSMLIARVERVRCLLVALARAVRRRSGPGAHRTPHD